MAASLWLPLALGPMAASLCLAALAGVLLMGAGTQAQEQYCNSPCPPCGACVQSPCPAITPCPASAPCTVISNANTNTAPEQGVDSGAIGRGFGFVKGKGPNSTDDAAAGGGTTQTCCSCSCHGPVCPNVTCTIIPASSSTGGGNHRGLSSGQVGGIIGGILAALAVFFAAWKYGRFFFPRRQEPEDRRHRRAHHHRVRGTGTGATVTIDINVEPRSPAPASPCASASSSAPASPARSFAPSSSSTAPPSPIMYGFGVPSIFGGADQEQEQEQEGPGCVVM